MSMHKRDEAQKGIVSFLVTLIMMLVISLIVIGFTQVANRTQREALDRQLSAQAQYAAESGINMVTDKVVAGVSEIADSCSDVKSSTSTYYVSNLSLSSNVSVTCILVDPTPDNVKITPSQTKSVIVPIKSADSNPVSNLTFSWARDEGVDTADATGCPATAVFPTNLGSNCTFALLRVDLMVTPGVVNQSNLDAATIHTFYLQPVNHNVSGNVSFSAGSVRGVVAPVQCGTECSVTIDGLGPSNSFYARISTIYKGTQGVTISGNSNMKFSGAQAVIDATGKAEDVLKRVQVRKPIGITYGEAPYAVQSESTICKRYTVGTGVFDAGGCD